MKPARNVKNQVTLKDRRAHLGGYDPDSFVEDPDWQTRYRGGRGKKPWYFVALLALVLLMGLARRFGLFTLLGWHAVR
ncbi:MAG: hypothetical protein H6865_02565 [Rhodospirillales bacterium]|nr:hypothetical protein [Alphaproteobacteria bacterium]MCB9986499.1 hypothetical protein [Rhodospirillales bacterium]USO06958.1 MAG: hypothetical protein H6866_05820 [Rhodospirillales bacterium]